MKLFPININATSTRCFETFINSITPLQKKVSVIALLIFSCFAAGYLVFKCCLKEKNPEKCAKLIENDFFSKKISKNEKLRLAKTAGPLVKWLSFNHADFTENDFKDLFNYCPNITHLIFENCKIEEAAFQHFPTKLEYLGIKALIENDFKNFFIRCCAIKKLVMKDCTITDKSIQHFPFTLTDLMLSNTKIEDSVFKKINCPSLKELWINKNSTLEKPFDNLPKNLNRLSLTNCTKLTNDSLFNLPEDLNSFYLNNITNLTTNGLTQLPKNLEYLHIVNMNGISLKSLPVQLKDLHLSNCLLNDDALYDLPNNVEDLTIIECKNLTNDHLTPLTKYNSLRRLILRDSDYLTDTGIAQLQFLTELQYLDLSNCKNLTNSMTENLPKKLHSLYLYECPFITNTIKNPRPSTLWNLRTERAIPMHQ